LEGQNRTLKRGGILVLAAVSCLALMGQSPGEKVWDELRARRLVIVDEAGTTRAVLDGVADGAASLVLHDHKGNERVILRAYEVGVGLFFRDDHGGVWASLSAQSARSALTLRSDDEVRGDSCKGRVELWASSIMTSLELQTDGMVNSHTTLGSDYAGRTQLCLEGSQGYSIAVGGTELVTPSTGTTTKRSTASIVMFDREKHVVWEAP